MENTFDWQNHKIVVVIPAYNEERCIGSVVLKLRQYPVDILVVDDGSLDDTALIATAAGAQVIHHLRNQGKGVALNTGLHARFEEVTHDCFHEPLTGEHLLRVGNSVRRERFHGKGTRDAHDLLILQRLIVEHFLLGLLVVMPVLFASWLISYQDIYGTESTPAA